MLQLVLIRPGATDYDQQQRIQGKLDIPLSESGCAEVAQVLRELDGKGMETIYAPQTEPAWQTAATIAKGLGIKVKKLERMHNLDLGFWQGMLVEDVRYKQPKGYRQWQDQPEHACPPEGEMLSDAEERVRSAMTKLLKRHKSGVIGMVVSEPLATLVDHYIRHDELDDLWTALERHGCWEILQIEPAEILAHGG